MIINREDYTERAMHISVTRINVLSVVIVIPIAIISAYIYGVLDIDKKSDLFSFFLLLFIGIILHELIHAIVAVKYAQAGWKSIKFGVMWKYLAPYCHCKEALTVGQYRKFVMTPTLVAVACLIISFFIHDWTFTMFSVVMVGGGAGDIYIISKLRKEDPQTLVVDYPDKIGSAILEKKR